MHFAVIVFPGSNCDHDAYHVFRHILDVPVDFVWHRETDLKKYDAIIIPGGFSYGDYLRTGAIARFSPVMESVIKEAHAGKPVFGICNGFQILIESGLLPGALIINKDVRFLSQDVTLEVDSTDSIYTRSLKKGRKLTMPIAHKQGNLLQMKIPLKCWKTKTALPSVIIKAKMETQMGAQTALQASSIKSGMYWE